MVIFEPPGRCKVGLCTRLGNGLAHRPCASSNSEPRSCDSAFFLHSSRITMHPYSFCFCLLFVSSLSFPYSEHPPHNATRCCPEPPTFPHIPSTTMLPSPPPLPLPACTPPNVPNCRHIRHPFAVLYHTPSLSFTIVAFVSLHLCLAMLSAPPIPTSPPLPRNAH
jgi:hypothetical protein